jgi:lycopene beta-cyclase
MAVTSEINIACDIAIIGGGLSGGLIALALAAKRPDLDVRIIEAQPHMGGNHVWSFFDSDIAPDDRWLVEPLICHSWQGYDVAFPGHSRTFDAVYNTIESERLDAAVRAALRPENIIAAQLASVEPNRPDDRRRGRHLWHYDLTLTDGTSFKARQVIDARGPGDLSTLEVGWQKFVGLSVHVPGGHGLDRPIIMDATVAQLDGYRFIYCLPFDAETVFIEDTYYSDTPGLDVAVIRERIIDYARARGWTTNGGGREETGVLPVVIGGDFDAYWASTGQDVAKAGLRAGLFHATTGYSLPDAVRLAARMAQMVEREGISFANQSHDHARQQWRKRGFYRMLDTMLFHAAAPDQRYKVLERFYRLSPGLITRFYAGKSTLADKIRVLSGKPPVPIGRAIRALLGKR